MDDWQYPFGLAAIDGKHIRVNFQKINVIVSGNRFQTTEYGLTGCGENVSKPRSETSTKPHDIMECYATPWRLWWESRNL